MHCNVSEKWHNATEYTAKLTIEKSFLALLFYTTSYLFRHPLDSVLLHAACENIHMSLHSCNASAYSRTSASRKESALGLKKRKHLICLPRMNQKNGNMAKK